MSNSLLTVKNLSVSLHTRSGSVNAVRGLNYDLEPGGSLGIVGESGSGKTIGSLALTGILPSTVESEVTGSAGYAGQDLLAINESELEKIRGGEIAYIFQDPVRSLNPYLTAGTQVAEALTTHLGTDKREARRMSIDLLGRMGIENPQRAFGRYPHELSGGMCQRVAIAAGLSCSPRILIADEPTTNLDVATQLSILDLITGQSESTGMALMFISHDIGVIRKMCGNILVMYAGAEVECGPTDSVTTEPRHPYTRGLLNSLPSLSRRRDRLPAMDGMPPDPTHMPTGCPFYPRCPVRKAECRDEKPETRETEPGWMVACHAEI